MDWCSCFLQDLATYALEEKGELIALIEKQKKFDDGWETFFET